MRFFCLFLFLVLSGCAAERHLPAAATRLSIDSLQRLAQLPPYLVPPPAQASPKQVQQWVDAQTAMLGNVGAPAGKVKLKNVGNTDDHTKASVQQGITGRQITTGAVILGLAFLLLKLGPAAVKLIF
ncbi:hypothetical protein [Hymenobacter algoricola]|uniref:Lipoprotein n=1 Tax=Hymenobacter algoricola TaxID=486267 RepID=A0ABP7NTW4_9BACT